MRMAMSTPSISFGESNPRRSVSRSFLTVIIWSAIALFCAILYRETKVPACEDPGRAWHGRYISRMNQVCNAVPPAMEFAVAQAVLYPD